MKAKTVTTVILGLIFLLVTGCSNNELVDAFGKIVSECELGGTVTVTASIGTWDKKIDATCQYIVKDEVGL